MSRPGQREDAPSAGDHAAAPFDAMLHLAVTRMAVSRCRLGHFSRVLVVCDICGGRQPGEYAVIDPCDEATGLAYARARLRLLDWRCDETGDRCPRHAGPL